MLRRLQKRSERFMRENERGSENENEKENGSEKGKKRERECRLFRAISK